MKKKVVIAVTGASGAVYAKQLIKCISEMKEQISDYGIVFSENAKEVWKHEIGDTLKTYSTEKVYKNNDFFAPFASGSANYDVMFICPCSMGTLGRIAHGYADDLISRAADVMLKENKKLILLVREMPYNLVHIENFKILAQAGAIICPASPSFYSKPQSKNEIINTVVDKLLSLAGFSITTFRWGENMK